MKIIITVNVVHRTVIVGPAIQVIDKNTVYTIVRQDKIRIKLIQVIDILHIFQGMVHIAVVLFRERCPCILRIRNLCAQRVDLPEIGIDPGHSLMGSFLLGVQRAFID